MAWILAREKCFRQKAPTRIRKLYARWWRRFECWSDSGTGKGERIPCRETPASRGKRKSRPGCVGILTMELRSRNWRHGTAEQRVRSRAFSAS